MFWKWFRKGEKVALPSDRVEGGPAKFRDPAKPPSWDMLKMLDKQGQLIGTMLIHRGIPYPDARKPLRAYVTFKYRGRPLPTSEERNWMDELEVPLERIEEECDAKLVCIWTSNGVRDFTFYLSSAEPFASRVQAELALWKPELAVDADRSWGQYTDFLEMVDDPTAK